MTFLYARHLMAALCAAGPLLAGGVSAWAGSNNEIYIRQESSPAGEGNRLTVDQSGASNSLVRGFGPADAASNPALQSGTGNTATLTIRGVGGEVRLEQDNTVSGPTADETAAIAGTGNSASVNLTGEDALASVLQQGQNNAATLTVSGIDAQGSILQDGDGNRAGLTVTGASSSGSITQNGNGNETDLAVTSPDSDVAYVVNGDNLSSVTQNGAVEVFTTNPGQVTITQTTLP